jgi:hypothetical protein
VNSALCLSNNSPKYLQTCPHKHRTTEHILHDCRKPPSLRDEAWPEPTAAYKKLYRPVEELKRTTIFITSAALQR